MNPNDTPTILLEILRVGLIAIRNLSESTRSKDDASKLRHWANLCHSLPAVLLGDCDARAVKYFIKGDLLLFCSSYPKPIDADFCQISALKAELEAIHL